MTPLFRLSASTSDAVEESSQGRWALCPADQKNQSQIDHLLIPLGGTEWLWSNDHGGYSSGKPFIFASLTRFFAPKSNIDQWHEKQG
ncbi:MAG: hypothetical protein HW380_2741 [Magnetococcales bacterium]|nr:hypothetical protein [Magnetococcales bacterium]